MADLIPVVALLAPLAAALANGISLLCGDRALDWRTVQRLTVGATAVAFAAALAMFALVLADPAPRRVALFDWVVVGDLKLSMGLLIDTLSALMALMVTGFALVIGRFSINYMHREQGFTRYFAVYALFVFAMLVLVLGDNYVMLFAGWEAVGVCSYLLIGQYYDRTSAAKASTEAFVANRVGDAGFVVGLLILLNEFGSVQFAEVNAALARVDEAAITAAALCLLLGALGKSAQLPLGSWLAKAMEGPTPSSALIHAATMVTAGVYLIVRSQALFNAAPEVLWLVALIGAATALYGAVVGQTVSDIKGMLAASTTTQLGFMFLACGLGAYAVAVFHLLAHAFYKSYQFLTAPSILHHLHGRVDPAALESTRDERSVYTIATLIAGLLVAVPLALGLDDGTAPVAAWGASAWLLIGGGLLALASAAHYAYNLTRRKFDDHRHVHEHAGQAHGPALDADSEAPGGAHAPILWPLGLIAVAAAAGVLLQIFPGGVGGSWFHALLAPLMAAPLADSAAASGALRAALAAVLIAMVVYAWFSTVFLARYRAEAVVDLKRWRALYVAALNRFWLDRATQRWVVDSVYGLARLLERFDAAVIERLSALPGRLAVAAGRVLAWIDERARGAAERSAGALAAHFGQVANLIERHFIAGIESALRTTAAAAARVGATIEEALARPAVAITVIGLAIAGALLGVNR